ncbi:O-antigen polysaccharide polymerase Wzy [Photobacterium swingsii]|uniref:O-antigen polysaccharide polymerase Wzy n=1 Tax=Photobacterium swingsii TaxID=680026 RepID=UPI00352D4A14
MLNHKRNFLILQVFIAIASICLVLANESSENYIIDLELLINFFKLYFIYIVISACIFVKRTSLYTIFLFCYFIFFLGGVFFGGLNAAKTVHTVAGFEVLPDSLVVESICFHFLVISLIHLGFAFSLFTLKGLDRVPFKPNLFYNARLLFLFSLPFCVIKFIYEIKTIAVVGYVGYYKYGVEMPFFINLMRFIFETSFLLLLSSSPSFSTFKKYTLIFMLVMTLFLVTGVRSKFILYLIFVGWYYYRFYQSKDLSVFRILIAVVSLIFVLLLSQLYRQNWVFNSDLNYFEYFFVSQSISFYILPLTIKYIGNFTSELPTIFSPFSIEALIYNSQSLERLEHVQFLGDVISYSQLGDLYLDGNGIGGSFIAELYQAGVFIAVFLSFSLGLFINYFNEKVFSNRFLLAISFFIVSNVAYMPRSSFFKSPYMLLVYIFIFYFFYITPAFKLFSHSYKLNK